MSERSLYRQRLWIGALAALVVDWRAVGNDRPKTIPISGRVTIDGKAPGEPGKIFFTPIQAAPGYSMRPARGSFNAEGNYRVLSWAPDDGLVPAHYTVSVVFGEPSKIAIPARYQSKRDQWPGAGRAHGSRQDRVQHRSSQ